MQGWNGKIIQTIDRTARQYRKFCELAIESTALRSPAIGWTSTKITVR